MYFIGLVVVGLLAGSHFLYGRPDVGKMFIMLVFFIAYTMWDIVFRQLKVKKPGNPLELKYIIMKNGKDRFRVFWRVGIGFKHAVHGIFDTYDEALIKVRELKEESLDLDKATTWIEVNSPNKQYTLDEINTSLRQTIKKLKEDLKTSESAKRAYTDLELKLVRKDYLIDATLKFVTPEALCKYSYHRAKLNEHLIHENTQVPSTVEVIEQTTMTALAKFRSLVLDPMIETKQVMMDGKSANSVQHLGMEYFASLDSANTIKDQL